MARPDPTIVLIRSMSRREKQHFKREAAAQSGHARYVELFDAIARQYQASDAEIKTRLEARWDAKKPKPLKAYLFKSLTRSLIQYLEGQVPSDEARFLLQQAALLKDRGLQEKALKALDRASRLAGESFRYDLLWQAHELRRIVLAGRRDKLYRSENLQASLAHMEQAAERMLEYSRALRLYYRVYEGNWRSSREDQEALYVALQAPEHRALAESPNAMARLCHHLAWSHYAVLSGDIESSEAHQRALLELYDAHPGLLAEHPQFSLSTAFNLANRLLMRGDLEGFPGLVERVRAIPPLNPRVATKRLECLSAQAFHYAALTAQSLEGSAWSEALHAEAEAPLPFTASHRIDVVLKRGLYHWCGGRPEEALDALLENERNPDLKRMHMHLALGQLVMLLAHADLGNTELAADAAKRMLRQHRKGGFEHAFEAPMYRFLEQLGRHPEAGQLDALIAETLETLASGQELPNHRLYLPLEEWLVARRKGGDFAEGVRRSGAHWPRIPAEKA